MQTSMLWTIRGSTYVFHTFTEVHGLRPFSPCRPALKSEYIVLLPTWTRFSAASSSKRSWLLFRVSPRCSWLWTTSMSVPWSFHRWSSWSGFQFLEAWLLWMSTFVFVLLYSNLCWQANVSQRLIATCMSMALSCTSAVSAARISCSLYHAKLLHVGHDRSRCV